MTVRTEHGRYEVTVDRSVSPQRPIVLTERGDTVTENALIAAARGARNRMLPGWITLAFLVGAIGIAAGTTGGVETDAGVSVSRCSSDLE